MKKKSPLDQGPTDARPADGGKPSLRHLKGLFGPLATPVDIDEAIMETVSRRTPERTDPDP